MSSCERHTPPPQPHHTDILSGMSAISWTIGRGLLVRNTLLKAGGLKLMLKNTTSDAERCVPEYSYNSTICPCEMTKSRTLYHKRCNQKPHLHRAVPRNSFTPLYCIYKAKLKDADWPCCSLKTLHQGKYESLSIKEYTHCTQSQIHACFLEGIIMTVFFLACCVTELWNV